MTCALTLSIDVPDIQKGVDFFTRGLGFSINAQLEPTIYELEYAGVRVFLLEKKAGTVPCDGERVRQYERHWTPVHLDLEVDDLDSAIERALIAGAIVERKSSDPKWGDIATFSDPFGHGFCLIKPIEDSCSSKS